MAITQFFGGSYFDPEATQVMGVAFEMAREAFPQYRFTQKIGIEFAGGSRANAVKECNAEAQKMSQDTWADPQIHKYRSCMMQHGEQQE
jgi:hypothetical protein